jgi:hypothetical protein
VIVRLYLEFIKENRQKKNRIILIITKNIIIIKNIIFSLKLIKKYNTVKIKQLKMNFLKFHY